MEAPKSRIYAGCLQRAIQYAGINTTMNMEGGNPDVDFYCMSHAKKMVVSVGGYSRLIGNLVVRFGGTVFGRTF